jgi:hypothetical protein
MTRAPTGIGFRVKTGYAIAIVLAGPSSAPEFLLRRTVMLSDLDDDDSRQPYHAGLHRGEPVGTVVVRQARRDAEARAASALKELVRTAVRAGAKPRSIGLVVGSDVDPLSLGNLHIRAHALEGRFYREALEAAAAAAGLPSILLLERDAFEAAAPPLAQAPAEIETALAAMGKAAGRPWRKDERLAALAAWVALAS